MIRTVPIKIYTFCPYLKSKTETTYDISGNNPVSITTNYRYNSYRLPSFVSQSGSRSASDSTAVITKYPFDNNGSPYSTMTQKFMLNYPIETIKCKGNSITDGKLITYKQVLIANDTLFVPDKVFSTEITSPLTSFSYFNGATKDSHYGLFPEMEFVTYGPKGNISEIKDRKGISTTYLWGYSYQHPIAEIKNATYVQIDGELGSTYISGLANNSNPSASDLNNLNSLRTSSSLPDIEVNTFTYKPFLGMTSKTDPRGVSTYFTYDTFGRLVLNQDNDNNILARYRYSYHDNGPGYVLSVSLKAAPFYVQDVTDSATINISAKGSGNYSYSWSLLNGTTVLATGNSKSFIFACSQVGNLTVSCIVTDNVTGRKLEKKKSITCYNVLAASVAVASYYILSTTGSATVTPGSDSGNYSYRWLINGTAVTGTSDTLSFTFPNVGTYYITCIVTDNVTGQTATDTKSVTCYTIPTATITLGSSSYSFNATGSATVSASGGSGSYSYSWSLLYGSTVLATGSNSNSFSFTCSQSGTLTVKCVVTDTITGQTTTVTQNLTCTSPYGNFTLNSGYFNYYNSLEINGSTVLFILAFGNSSAMNTGVSYLVAYLPAGFKPSVTRTVTLYSNGQTWSITFNPFGTVYCQIVSGPSLPMGAGANLSGSFNL